MKDAIAYREGRTLMYIAKNRAELATPETCAPQVARGEIAFSANVKGRGEEEAVQGLMGP